VSDAIHTTPEVSGAGAPAADPEAGSVTFAADRVATATDGERDDRRRRPRPWRWAALFVGAYTILGVAWAGSNPPSAAPDEPDHLIKAIGMGRLDIGDDYDEPLPEDPILVRRNLSITRLVDVPADLVPIHYPVLRVPARRHC
jgi:hypothetical protein